MNILRSRPVASLAIPTVLVWLTIVIVGALVSERGHRALAELASAASRMKSIILVGGIFSVVLTFVCVGLLRLLAVIAAPVARKKIPFLFAGAFLGGAVSYALGFPFNGPGAVSGHALLFLPVGLLCGFLTAAFRWRPQSA